MEAATDDVVAQLKALPFNIVAVLPGAETGVELSDRLSHRMHLRTNGESGSLARRNKYLMGETVSCIVYLSFISFSSYISNFDS